MSEDYNELKLLITDNKIFLSSWRRGGYKYNLFCKNLQSLQIFLQRIKQSPFSKQSVIRSRTTLLKFRTTRLDLYIIDNPHQQFMNIFIYGIKVKACNLECPKTMFPCSGIRQESWTLRHNSFHKYFIIPSRKTYKSAAYTI